MPRKIAKYALDALLVLVGAVLLYSCAHGWWMDAILDRMHDDSCYHCNAYRLAHMDDAAFQVREARRAARH